MEPWTLRVKSGQACCEFPEPIRRARSSIFANHQRLQPRRAGISGIGRREPTEEERSGARRRRRIQHAGWRPPAVRTESTPSTALLPLPVIMQRHDKTQIEKGRACLEFVEARGIVVKQGPGKVRDLGL